METLLSSPLQFFQEEYWNKNGDPRVQHLPLMRTPKELMAIMLAYALFVKVIGPQMMKNRKPYSLKPVLLVYNLGLSLVNFAFFLQFILHYRFGLELFNLNFSGYDNNHPVELYRCTLINWYLLSKIVDLFDTIFFVLRKKDSQVTGLHFYHHFSVPLLGWFYNRLNGTGNIVLMFAMLNSFVHTIMYAYYGLSALGPQMTPYLWWKRYITQLQIVQFVILIVHGFWFYLFSRGYPTNLLLILLSQSLLYLVLFTKFYINSYKKKKLQ